MTRRFWFIVWTKLGGGLALLGFSVQAEQVSPSTAWDAYRRGNYRNSQAQYSELAKKSPDDPRLRFNAGAAAFRQNDLTNAANWFESALSAPDLRLQQQAYYNLGNTRYRLGESLQDPQARKQLWSEALTNFVSAMKLDQSDTNAASNYAYVRQQLQQLEQQQPPPQQQQQQKQNHQKNQDQKDQDNEPQDSQDQQQKDQQKQDPSEKQQDNSGSQDQKQSGKPDQEKENSGADPQSADEKSKSESEKESEAKSSKPGESGEGKEGQEGEAQGAEAGEGEAGQMSAAQAVQMLESRKGDEKALLLRSTGNGKEAAERAARIRKPW